MDAKLDLMFVLLELVRVANEEVSAGEARSRRATSTKHGICQVSVQNNVYFGVPHLYTLIVEDVMPTKDAKVAEAIPLGAGLGVLDRALS